MAGKGSRSSDLHRETKNEAAEATNAAHDTPRNLYSQAAESASEAAGGANQAARQMANSFGDVVKDWIEQQPYAAVAIAFGIGWLYGRTHRPF